MRWRGPKCVIAPFCRIDLRVGNFYHNCMCSPEGKDYWSTSIYRKIVPPERIVCTDSFADEQGNIVPAAHYGMNADFPLEILVTVTFEEYAGKTKAHPAACPWLRTGLGVRIVWQGCNESFDKLVKALAKD